MCYQGMILGDCGITLGSLRGPFGITLGLFVCAIQFPLVTHCDDTKGLHQTV